MQGQLWTGKRLVHLVPNVLFVVLFASLRSVAQVEEDLLNWGHLERGLMLMYAVAVCEVACTIRARCMLLCVSNSWIALFPMEPRKCVLRRGLKIVLAKNLPSNDLIV